MLKGTSLVGQWLRIPPPAQRTCVCSLGKTAHAAGRNYWSCVPCAHALQQRRRRSEEQPSSQHPGKACKQQGGPRAAERKRALKQ